MSCLYGIGIVEKGCVGIQPIRRQEMEKKKIKRKVKTRNPYATSLNKAQYKKRIVPSKKKDIKPEIDYEN
jgi:hypothetical protein